MHESHTDCDCYRKDSECCIAYCKEIATYQVEIKGFRKQYMCVKHMDLTYQSTRRSHWYGAEVINQ